MNTCCHAGSRLTGQGSVLRSMSCLGAHFYSMQQGELAYEPVGLCSRPSLHTRRRSVKWRLRAGIRHHLIPVLQSALHTRCRST